MSAERRPLVLELGGRWVRAGVSGERAPRCVLRWEVRPPVASAFH